jgi:hypothetical protein
LGREGGVRSASPIPEGHTRVYRAVSEAEYRDIVQTGRRLAPKRGAQNLTGQQHHAVPKKVHRAIERHPNLRGQYQARDPRFVTQAKDLPSHRGYQRWHRELDGEVVKWVEKNPQATPADFDAYLRHRYSQPDLIERFPNGLGGAE